MVVVDLQDVGDPVQDGCHCLKQRARRTRLDRSTGTLPFRRGLSHWHVLQVPIFNCQTAARSFTPSTMFSFCSCHCLQSHRSAYTISHNGVSHTLNLGMASLLSILLGERPGILNPDLWLVNPLFWIVTRCPESSTQAAIPQLTRPVSL